MINRLVVTLFVFLVLTGRAWAQTGFDDLIKEAQGTTSGQPQVQTQNAKISALGLTLQVLLQRPTPEQNVFIRLIESESWAQALIQFKPAFEGLNNTSKDKSDFAASSNGLALKGYLQYKSGLETLGLKTLLAIKDPKEINLEFLKAWKEAAPEKKVSWNLLAIEWNDSWLALFGPNHQVQYQLNQTSVKQSDELKKLADRALMNTPVHAEALWKLLLSYSLKNQADQSAKILSQLVKSNQTVLSPELLNLTAARLLFQNGYFEASVQYFKKVSKKSFYWPQAQEELAWTYLKKGEPQNALAITKSLTHPTLKNMVGSEVYLIQALANLKICDYAQVLETLKQFSPQFKTKTVELAKLVENSQQPQILELLSILQKRNLNESDLAQLKGIWPRQLLVDRKFKTLAIEQAQLASEAKKSEEIFVASLSQTGLQGDFEVLKRQADLDFQKSQSVSLGRVKELAQQEIEEISATLKKLHIIEAEVIQQVSIADKLAQNTKNQDINSKTGSTGAQGNDLLRFPAEKEVWFDEVSFYKVDVKRACQGKKTL